MTEARNRDIALDDRAVADLHPRLLALARATGARDAEDLAQTTVEVGIRNLGKLRDPDKLWPWLVSIQTRELFRWSRRIRNIRLHDEPAAPTLDVDTNTDVKVALRKLPQRMRIAVSLRYMAGLSVAETARALGTTENTVKTQLRIGLQRMKDDLDERR